MSDSSDSGATKRSTKAKGKPCTPTKRAGTARARRPVLPRIKIATRQESALSQTHSPEPEPVPILETAHTQEVEPSMGIQVEVITDSSDGEGYYEGLLQEHLTSTPEIPPQTKPRSDSSLLRIKAQLRAAAAATLESSVRQAAEPEDGEKSNESVISDTSAVGGGALHEMPRLAGALLQQSKAKLEESRTLNKETREAICSGLHGLYEMILRLADSRNRHIAEKERSKSHYEHIIGRMEARHANALKDLQNKQQEREAEIASNVLKTFKEAEASRYLVYEIEARFRDHAAWEQRVESELCKLSSNFNSEERQVAHTSLTSGQATTANMASYDAVIKIQKDIEELRQELCARDAAKIAESQPLTKLQPLTRQEVHDTTQTPSVRPSYASVVGRPQHGVILESVDPRQTSGDIMKDVQSKVDVINLGIRINKVSKLSKQRVVINCDTEEDKEALKRAIESSNNKLTISTTRIKKPLIKLIGVISDLTDAKIEEAILKQNSNLVANLDQQDASFRVLRRTKGRNNLLTNVVLEVSTALWKTMKDQKLRIGYQVITAVDQSPIVQCYKCMSFGHKAQECKNGNRCGHCADNHDSRACPNRSDAPTCVNCKSKGSSHMSHPAYSSDCPEWSKWDRLARAAVAYC